jgi:hypothetical protein
MVEPILKPIRLRSKAHLDRLKALPCCIPGCREREVDAHHITTAQPKGRGIKVSDEFSVPLCRWVHHSATSKDAVHFASSEREWWRQHQIDPLILAEKYWEASQALGCAIDEKPRKKKRK